MKNSSEDTTNNSLDTILNTWYSNMLFALNEPILENYRGDKEIYRFTWLRTFHHPISVRLEKQNNILRMFAKVCNGAGGYDPGNIISDTTISISTNEWTVLENKIVDTRFWQLKTENRDDTGKDGSEWIMEGVKENKYHVVTRWTPSKEGQANFRDLGEYFVRLSKIKIVSDHFY